MIDQLHPLQVSTADINGGAARAAYRLHHGLRQNGVDSHLLAFHRASGDANVVKLPSKWVIQQVKLSTRADTLPLQLYRQRSDYAPWSLNWLPNGVADQINLLNPSVVHLHWVGGGLLPVEDFAAIDAPMVWTFHDMWAMTGGCHYAGDCDGYTRMCGQCPQLNSRRAFDLSRWMMRRKAQHWRDLNLTIVTPSRWLADCVKRSRLFHDARVEVIPNGIDLETYKPVEKAMARRLLNLPQDKKLVAFGALQSLTDKRKGVQYLYEAMHKLDDDDDLELVIFGASPPANPLDFGRKAHYPGYLHDDLTLALLYAAVDVFVAPSVQDNLPNTVMEALACGTPVVAFDIGGMPDMIAHRQNGYLAAPFDVADLAAGVRWVLEDAERHATLQQHARRCVETSYALSTIARRFTHLYEELLR